MKVKTFLKSPTQSRFNESKISGDIEKMKELYKKAPELAKRFFSCQDWVEMCEFEKSFSQRKIFLGHAVDSISSFSECMQVHELDQGYQYFSQLWVKFTHFAVLFDDMYRTIDIFHEYKKSKTGKKILKKIIELAETQEDLDILAGIVPSDNAALTDELCQKAGKIQKFSLLQ